MIWGWCGAIGQGKTFNGVREALALAYYRNALLLTNIHITPKGRNQPWALHQLTISPEGPISEEIIMWALWAKEHGHGTVFFCDEANTTWPSRAWAKMSVQMTSMFQQSRHLSVDLIYTTQYPELIDTNLRQLTNHIYSVHCIPPPTTARRERQKRPWFFIVDKFPVTHMEKAGKKKGMSSFVRYRREDESAYNTDEMVYTPAKLNEGRETPPFPAPPDDLPKDVQLRNLRRTNKKYRKYQAPEAIEVIGAQMFEPAKEALATQMADFDSGFEDRDQTSAIDLLKGLAGIGVKDEPTTLPMDGDQELAGPSSEPPTGPRPAGTPKVPAGSDAGRTSLVAPGPQPRNAPSDGANKQTSS